MSRIGLVRPVHEEKNCVYPKFLEKTTYETPIIHMLDASFEKRVGELETDLSTHVITTEENFATISDQIRQLGTQIKFLELQNEELKKSNSDFKNFIMDYLKK